MIAVHKKCNTRVTMITPWKEAIGQELRRLGLVFKTFVKLNTLLRNLSFAPRFESFIKFCQSKTDYTV
jgi:hypothetical protein